MSPPGVRRVVVSLQRRTGPTLRRVPEPVVMAKRAWLAAFLLAASLGLAATAVPLRAGASLSHGQREILRRYLDAFVARRFDAAFALLSDDERRYFGSPANLASVYAADRFKLDSYRILESKDDPPVGALAVVSEHIEFFDAMRQSPAAATAKVAYGIVNGKRGFRIKDPYHPWRALAPARLSAAVNNVSVTVRKLSFFTGRLEIVVTFANRADQGVTFLPYGRTVLRDEAGKVYLPIESRLPSLTDKTLFTGLRLPSSGQYTGGMTFLTPDRFSPKTLTLTIAPALIDGGDAPFELDLPTYALSGESAHANNYP